MSPYGGFEDDKIEGLADNLASTIDPDERSAVVAEAFPYVFEQYADMPLAIVLAEVTYDPEVFSNWVFRGVTTNRVSQGVAQLCW